jgi:hypothetical protein
MSDIEARKDKRHGQTKWTRRQTRLRSTIFHLIVFISCVVATTLYPPLKGKNIAMDEQDRNNTDSSVAEIVDADPATPAYVTLDKEAEATPPPAEVIDQTKNTKGIG